MVQADCGLVLLPPICNDCALILGGGRTKMVHKNLRGVIVGALMTIGCLGVAYAAPIAPAAMLSSPPIKLVSYWGRPYPYGYIEYRGQCYTYVKVDTPTGPAWQRVWICTETGGRGYGHGYGGRF